MNEIKKPKDILIATMSNPGATTMDLLRNDINASNTGLLSPEEYKSSAFILKQFSTDGVFDDDAFGNAYLIASNKYADLTDLNAYELLKKELAFSPVSMSKPINSKTKNIYPEYTTFNNPTHQLVGISGINLADPSEQTRAELAQGHKIWDVDKLKWSEKTAEEQGFFLKMFGNTLVYAQWEEDGVDAFGRKYRKGDWKLDASGEYYTETIGNRQLLDKLVVNVQDIITKEGSWINKYDFFDSDGTTKSVTGTVFKMMTTIAPYLIPGVNKWYGALSASTGLMSVLPTFYKSIEGLLTGTADSALAEGATSLENWFRKYEPSKSEEGRAGFWNLESFGELTASVFGLLHQQRAAASLSKYAMPKLANETLDVIQKRGALAKSFSLGYMALISAADTYNEALTSGYDERTAGFASLVSGSALYSIMNYNESLNGLGTWFLDKTTGYDQSISRGALRQAIKPFYEELSKGLDAIAKGKGTSKLVSTIGKIKKNVKSIGLDLAGATEGMWTNAIVEGVEEVTEEIVSDTVKGMVDGLSAIGLTKKEGSFGGWDNVFSKEGLSRYVATFVGGGLGGALFDLLENKLNLWLKQETKQEALNLNNFILRGLTLDLINEVNRFRKVFNDKLSPVLGSYNGKDIQMSAVDGKSLADIVADTLIHEIQMKTAAIPLDLREDYSRAFGTGNIAFDRIDSFHDYIRSDFTQLLTNIQEQQKELESLSENKASDPVIVEKSKNNLLASKEKLNNFFNGENYFNYLIQFGAYSDPKFRKAFSNLDVEGFAYHNYNVDYNNLDSGNNPSKITKEQIDLDYKDYVLNQSDDTFSNTLKPMGKLYVSLLEKYSENLKNWTDIEQQKAWLHSILSEYTASSEMLAEELAILEEIRTLHASGSMEDLQKAALLLYERHADGVTTLLKVLQKSPGIYTTTDKWSNDLAERLIKANIISLDAYTGEIKDLVIGLINSLASKLLVKNWSFNTVLSFIESLNQRLESGDTSNLYIKKITELEKTSKAENKAKDGQVHYISTNKIILNALNWDPDIFTSKASNILDSLKKMVYIDPDLLTQLDTIFNVKAILKLSLETILAKTEENSDEWIRLKAALEFVLNSDIKVLNALLNVADNAVVDGEIDVKLYEDILSKYDPSIAEAIDSLDFDVIITIGQSLDSIPEYKKFVKIRSNLKVAPENPLKEAIRGLFSKMYNGKKSDILDYILRKEGEINSLTDVNNFLLSKEEIDILIELGINALITLSALLEGTASMNPIIQDYLKAYHPEWDTRLQHFQVSEHSDVVAGLRYLNSIVTKLKALEVLHQTNEILKGAKDAGNRAKLNQNLTNFYNNGIEFKGQQLVSAKYDADIPHEEYILKSELELHNNTKNLSIEDKKQLIDQLFELFDTEQAFINNINALQIVQPDGVNSAFLINRIAGVMSMNPISYLEDYIRGLDGKLIMPRIDQELALMHVQASISPKGKELMRYVTATMASKYILNYNKNKKEYRAATDAHALIYVNGSPGVGKTSVVGRMVHDMSSKRQVILAAPNKQKAEDLGITILNNASAGVEMTTLGGVFSLLFNPEIANAIQEILQEFIHEFRHNEEFDKKVKALPAQEEDHIINWVSKNGTVSADVHINISEDLVATINNFSFDLSKLNLNYDIDNNSIVLIDEATLLDPFLLAILNEVALNTDTDVILFGDSGQKGFEMTIDGATYNKNTNAFFMNRPPALVGTFRSNNTALEHNLSVISKYTSMFLDGVYEVSITPDVASEIRLKLRFEPLMYLRTQLDAGNYLLRGDEVVHELDLFSLALSQIVTNIKFSRNTDTPANLKILISEHLEVPLEERADLQTQDRKYIENLLLTEGAIQSEFDFFYENSAKGIQGAEATYVVLYDIKASQSPINIDTDLQAINTYRSRAKEYTLIYENNDGLFTQSGVTTEVSDNIVSYSVTDEYITKKRDDKITFLNELITKFGEKKSQKETQRPPEKRPPIVKDGDPEEEVPPGIGGENNNKRTAAIKADYQAYEEANPNVVNFDTYYTNLNISKELLSEDIESRPSIDPNSPSSLSNLPGFVYEFWGKEVEGITIDKYTTWQEAAKAFESFKFGLISGRLQNIKAYQVLYKNFDAELDWVYNKPNDNDPTPETIMVLQAVVPSSQVGQPDLTITLGALRQYISNKNSFRNKIIAKGTNAIYTYDTWDTEVLKQTLIDIHNINGTKMQNRNPVFMPISGLKYFTIDEKNLSNNDRGITSSKMTVKLLLDFGYTIKGRPQIFKNNDVDFANFLQLYRRPGMGDLTKEQKLELKKTYYSRLWVTMLKTGAEGDIWEEFVMLHLVQEKYPGTSKNALALFNALVYFISPEAHTKITEARKDKTYKVRKTWIVRPDADANKKKNNDSSFLILNPVFEKDTEALTMHTEFWETIETLFFMDLESNATLDSQEKESIKQFVELWKSNSLLPGPNNLTRRTNAQVETQMKAVIAALNTHTEFDNYYVVSEVSPDDVAWYNLRNEDFVVLRALEPPHMYVDFSALSDSNLKKEEIQPLLPVNEATSINLFDGELLSLENASAYELFLKSLEGKEVNPELYTEAAVDDITYTNEEGNKCTP